MNPRHTTTLLLTALAITGALIAQPAHEARAQSPTVKTKVNVQQAQQLKQQRQLAWYNARQALDKLQGASLTYKLKLRRGSSYTYLQQLPPANYLTDSNMSAVREVMKACQIDFLVGTRRDYTVDVLDTKEARSKPQAVEIACLDNACYKRYGTSATNGKTYKGDISLRKGGDKPTEFAQAVNSLRKHCWDFTKYDKQL